MLARYNKLRRANTIYESCYKAIEQTFAQYQGIFDTPFSREVDTGCGHTAFCVIHEARLDTSSVRIPQCVR